MPSEDSARPLDGIRVLCLAQNLPGPFASLALVELGAEVIMVEPPRGGDPSRRFAPFFNQINKGKKSVALDLKSAAGKAAFQALAASARVVIEGFRPGVADRLGVGYTHVRAVRPDVVYCSISGYGQQPGEARVAGHDLSFQARAGMIGVRGFDPDAPGLPIADLASGMYAATAIVGAVLASPLSRCIDLSMTDAVLAFNQIRLAFDWHGEPNFFDRVDEPAYGVFATRTSPITLSISGEDHQWTALCAELGLAEYAPLGSGERRRRRAELTGLLAGVLATDDANEWLRRLAHRGVCAGRLNDAEAILHDPLFASRGSVSIEDGRVDVRSPLATTWDGPALPHPSELGADTADLLRSLGVDDDQIAAVAGALPADEPGPTSQGTTAL